MSEPKSSLISRIQALTKPRLVGWQFAADGQWDIAERSFPQHTARQTLSRIEHWLAMQTTGNIALEALLESENNERLFFGVRIAHLTTREKAGAVGRMITMGGNGDGLDATVQNIRSALCDQKLASTRPEYLELGVFDLWNRVKSAVVWERGKALGENSDLVMPEELPDKTQEPDAGFAPLHEPQTKPLMLEAAWKRNPDIGSRYQCWIGLPVSGSDITARKYRLSEGRYLSAVSTFIALSPDSSAARHPINPSLAGYGS